MKPFVKKRSLPAVLAAVVLFGICLFSASAVGASDVSGTAAVQETAQPQEAETQTVSVSEEAAEEETVTDALYADYILEHADPAYTGSAGIELVNVLPVKQTIADGAFLEEHGISKIDGIYETVESLSALIAVIPASVGVYMLDEEADYWVAYADTLLEDAFYEVLEAVFAENNNGGEVLDGCIYDKETGLVYIPRSLYENENGETELGAVQVQILQACAYEKVSDMSSSATVSEAEGTDSPEVKVQEEEAAVFALETTAYVDAGMDEDNLIVSVNGIPIEEEYYEYHSRTGEITIAYSSASISSVSVTEEAETIVDKILSLLEPVSVIAAESSEMPVYSGDGDYVVYVGEDVAAGDYFLGSMLFSYHDNYSDEDYSGYAYSVGSWGSADEDTYNLIKNGGTFDDDDLVSENSWVAYMTASVLPSSGATMTYQGSSSGDKTLDFSDYPDYQEGTRYDFSIQILLGCAHISSPIATDDDAGGGGYSTYTTVGIRVFDVDRSDGTMTIGIITSESHSTQSGFGIIKIAIGESTGYLDIVKTSSDTTITDGNSVYSLSGAQYTVYTDSDCTAVAKDAGGNNAVFTMDSAGNADAMELEAGTYYVKEVTAGTGYSLDDTVYTVTVTAEETTSLNVTDMPLTGYIDIVKSSSDTAITGGNSLYSLSGAQYTVYTDSACTAIAEDVSGRNAVFTLDAAGNADAAEMPLGTYYVKETTVGTGYSPDSTVYNVTVTAGTTTYVNGSSGVSDEPLTDTVNCLLQKADAESGENADLSGAVYQVSYYDNDEAGGEAVRTWYFETDGDGAIYLDESCLSGDYTSDSLYITAGGAAVLPLGSISVQEVLPPEGFLLDETVYTAVIAEDSSAAGGVSLTWSDDSAGRLVMTEEASEAYATHYESPVRGNLILYKTDADGNGMAYIPFLITRTWTNADGETQTESQIIVTDGNGFFLSSSEDRAAAGTNVFDAESYVSGTTWLGTDEELIAGASYNIWFGDMENMEDGKGPLLYGTYTVQELRCTANASQTLLTRTFTLDQTDEDGSIKTVTNDEETVFISVTDLTITIDTVAVYKATNGKVIYAAEDAAVTETLTIDNLSSTASYKVRVDFVDENGTSVGSAWSDAFTAESTSGMMTVSVDVMLDLSSYTAGGTVTALSYLYQVIDGTEYPVAQHADLTDEDEQLTIPSLSTSAVDSATGDRVGVVSGEAAIIDTVTYQDLEGGEEYILFQEIVDEDGNVYAFQEYSFTVSNRAASGTVTMPAVTVDTSALAGETLYVKETLYWVSGYDGDGEPVLVTAVVHDSVALEDEDQMIYYPDIETSAADGETADNVGTVEETATITDTVTLTNLVPGMTYTLAGTLMFQGSGQAVIQGGSEITASAVITVSEDGGVSVSGGTLSESSFDEDHCSADAVVELSFTLDSSLLEGSSAVVFETLCHNGVPVAEHSDIGADYQTVNYPKVETSAADSETGDHVGSVWGALINGIKTLLGYKDADGNGISDDVQQSIIDTVQLTNLVEGRTYTITGVLMDADTGEELLIGGQAVTQTAEIEVKNSKIVIVSGAENAKTDSVSDDGNQVSGSVNLVFSFDSSLLENEAATIVVFETLFHNGVQVAYHNDLTDTGQSVNEAELHTTAMDTATGGHTGSVSDQGSIIDEVNLAALVEDEEYTITGVLIDLDASTAEELVYIYDTDGNQITASATFTAATNDDTFQMTETDGFTVSGIVYLTFDLSDADVEGKSIAAAESIFHNGVLLSQHGLSYDEDGNLSADENQAVYYPTGKTNITDDTTGTHSACAFVTQTLTDSVYFQNLIIGKEYQITAALYDRETGEVIPGTETTVAFTAAADMSGCGAEDVAATEHADGTVTVSGYLPITFTFEYEGLEGMTIVAGEDFYVTEDEKTVKILSHLDMEDEVQTVKYPALHTNAYVGDLDEADVYNEDGSYAAVQITDTVSCENLWTTEDLAALCEEGLLIKGGDIEDLRNGEVYRISEEADYLIRGTLMVKETGEVLLDAEGNKVVSYASFTAETSDSSIDLTFDLDLNRFLDEDGACYLEGVTLVVYEELFLGSEEEEAMKVGSHEEIDDADQDIRFPEGSTHANDLTGSDVTDACTSDEEGHEHEVYASGSVQIIDEISYSNLHGGTEYTVSGTLADKETGEAVTDDDGDVLISSVVCDAEGNILSEDGTFTTEGEYDDEVSGTVYLLFAFSGACLAGKTVVVFETVLRDGQSVITHADLSDTAQTIRFPEIGTQAVDKNTGTSTAAAGETTITDTVSYTNLIPGETYTVSGWLMNKSAKTELKTSDGNMIRASVTFTADESGSGTVELEYDVDTSDFGNIRIVVFEELYGGSKLIASHKDLTDQNQTVSCLSCFTAAQTKDDEGVLPVLILLLTAAAVLSLAGLCKHCLRRG